MKQFHETFDLNNKLLSLNASDQPSQLLTALVKTRTFVWVQSKISKQTKHVHLRKLEKFHLASFFWKCPEKGDCDYVIRACFQSVPFTNL